MRILVISGSSFLGSKILEAAGGHETYGTYATNRYGKEAIRVDITDREMVAGVISDIRPDAVVLAAAQRDVDHCEENRDEAWTVNVEGTKNVIRSCNSHGANLVYISTDSVFDGEKRQYEETDAPHPVNYYGYTKWKAEEKVLATCPGAVVARVTILFGWNHLREQENFVTWVINGLRSGKELDLFTDRFTTPTFADHAAGVVVRLLEKGCQGIYHIAGKGCYSRLELGRRIATCFSLDHSLLKPARQKEMMPHVPRPWYGCLDVTKAEQELGIVFPGFGEALETMKEQEESTLR